MNNVIITSFLAGTALAVTAVVCIFVLPRYYSRGPLTIPTRTKPTRDSEEMLLTEQLSRTEQMLGQDGMNKLISATVTVVGLGGVGSHAAHLLVRSGVRHVRLIDFDLVTLSSLNRHAVAIREDVGLPKAVVTGNRLASFAGPLFQYDARVAMFQEQDADMLLVGSDFVLDCIDDLQTKIQLLAACTRLGIRVMSSLGAGGKVDPTRLRIAKLEDVSNDALAASLRFKSKGIQISPQIEYVYSTETCQVKLLGLDDAQQENPTEFGALPNFRLRVQPVLGTSPSSFGVAMAARVLTELAQSRQFIPIPVDSVSSQVMQQMLQKSFAREKSVFKRTPDQFTPEDAALLVTFFHRRCVFSDCKLGSHGIKLEFARFYTNHVLSVRNCVLVRPDIADAIYNAHSARLLGDENEVMSSMALTEEEIDHQDVTTQALEHVGKLLEIELARFL